ncbi:hypothetical protein RvY_11180 [Ramazzottius varieornatus]|uniref:Uncharacterized protein n=1 Tax=Ramazzottius varieornatus TaxID=947166 RepID=A0A1D1VFC0_RAMVA|nr:hypothetical protein RvY_11180 [Ramazzottius varieornatus]
MEESARNSRNPITGLRGPPTGLTGRAIEECELGENNATALQTSVCSSDPWPLHSSPTIQNTTKSLILRTIVVSELHDVTPIINSEPLKSLQMKNIQLVDSVGWELSINAFQWRIFTGSILYKSSIKVLRLESINMRSLTS